MSDFSDPDFNEGWFTVGRAPKAPSPASPSGNRHDGVALWRWDDPGKDYPHWFNGPLGIQGPSDLAPHIARPVDIDAARTAVIEAARERCAAEDEFDPSSMWSANRLAFADDHLRATITHLDALTTKGATT